MIDHLGIQCADMVVSVAFYDTVVAPLGASRLTPSAADARPAPVAGRPQAGAVPSSSGSMPVMSTEVRER